MCERAALPGDRALLPPSSADMFCLSPVGPTQLRQLDASVGASGPHDFAVRNIVSRPLAVDRSRGNPPCDPVARKTLPRPPHPHPASVTIAIRPSGGVGWREFVEMICPTGEAKYFCKGDWTAQIRLICFNKSHFRSGSNPAARPSRGRRNHLDARSPGTASPSMRGCCRRSVSALFRRCRCHSHSPPGSR
jgi:hypothetical protein